MFLMAGLGKINDQYVYKQMDSGKLSYNIDNVFGSTSASIQLLAHAQGCLLYVSGPFLVFYSPKLDEQVAYLRHSSPLITAIAVSNDEKLLAVADRAKPTSIAVYDISSLQALKGAAVKPILNLRGHKHNIDLLVWSPNGRYLLSISNHDGSMFLWERSECLTKNRISKSVARAAFDASGDLVTVGRGYLKVWRFSGGEVLRKKQEDCWIMQGKVLTFGKTFSSKDFVELVYYGEKVLLLSSDGMLCIMAAKYQRVEKWIDLVMPRAMGLRVVGSQAICGGDNALVKSIDLQTLTLRHKFPKPPPVSKENLNEEQQLYYGEEEQFPACQGILQVSDFIVTLYAGRSLFIWRLGEQPIAVRSIISHRGSVHSLSLLQQVKGDICFFASCSEDGTVRLWHFYKKEFEGEQRSIDVAQAIGIKRNVYCRNLTRIIYSHSEMPLIRVRMLTNNTIACISNQELLLYSLDNFQLLLLHNFQEEQGGKHPSRILALDTNEDMVFVGDEAGKVRLYRPQGQTLVKLREFSLEMPIQALQVFSKRMLVYGKGRMKCLTLEGETLLNQYNVDCAVGFGNSVIYCERTSAVVYNLTRSRKTGSVSLNHQLDSGQTVRLARSNSWLIVLLTTRNRIIITNFTCTILYSEQLGDAITDLAVAEGGELLLATESGCVVVRRQESNRYVRMDEKVKRWFQLNDMSWMDGSVWASSQRQSHNQSHSHSNNTSKQLQGIGIDVQNSIRIGDESVFRSVGMRPPASDLALSYKNQQNKRSIFNPGQICAQANQIYQNVNQLIKNRGAVNSPTNLPDKSKSLKRRIFKGDDQEEKREKEKNEKAESPKDYVPSFANNLIESVIGDCPPSAISNKPSSNILSSRHQKQVISTEDQDCVIKSRAEESSINFGFVQFQEPSRGSLTNEHFNYTQTKNQGRNSDFLSSVDLLLQNHDQLLDNRENVHSMVLEHYEEYQRLYKLLSVEFGKGEREEWTNSARENFQKMAEGFLASLQK